MRYEIRPAQQVDPTYLDPVQAQDQLAVLLQWAEHAVNNHPWFLKIPPEIVDACDFWLTWSQALLANPQAFLGVVTAINTESGAHPPTP